MSISRVYLPTAYEYEYQCFFGQQLLSNEERPTDSSTFVSFVQSITTHNGAE